MLTITVPGATEFFDEGSRKFLAPTEDFVLELEYSLVALSKWESKHEKPFLKDGEKTTAEVKDFIRAMVISPQHPPEEIFDRLSDENYGEIQKYIEAKMTATWFKEVRRETGEIITNEVIYYWMFSFGIDIECENWHLNRLLTLIKVFGHKNAKPEKMSREEIYEQNRRANAERRAQLGTSG